MAAATNVAAELSSLTGQTWTTTQPDHRGVYLTREDDGLTLWLIAGWGRPNISLSLTREEMSQRHSYSDPEIPEIGVNFLTRTAAIVAREIVRRLLPDAEVYRVELAGRIARANAYHSSVTDNMTRLTDAADGVLTRVREDSADVRSGEVWGSVRVSSESVTLELRSLPIELAARVLALLGGI